MLNSVRVRAPAQAAPPGKKRNAKNAAISQNLLFIWPPFFSDKDSEAIAELLFVRYLLSMDEKSPLKFDLPALLAFSTVAKERNMRKAAQVLNISQPPLSRKIRRLEENLGIILFKRHSEGVELTEDGKKVFSITHPLLEQASEISNELAKLAQYRRAL